MDQLVLVYKNGVYTMNGNPAIVAEYGSKFKSIDEAKKAYDKIPFGVAGFKDSSTIVFMVKFDQK